MKCEVYGCKREADFSYTIHDIHYCNSDDRFSICTECHRMLMNEANLG